MSKSDVLVVGGSGFVGSHLARHMVKMFNVRVFDAKPPAIDLKDRVDFQTGDIRDFASVNKAVTGVDVIIDTAIIGIPLINEQKRLGYEVNVLGTQNVCQAVNRSESAKGMILTGTWHVFGERDLERVINEEYGCRPDKVEERARFYCLSKTVQENIVRLYDESYDKIYGIIRLGTVLGNGMPEKTAANLFISNALLGKPITPFRHSMHRPMLYVDVSDVCTAVEVYAKKILNNEIDDKRNSLAHIVNFAWPNPVTIIDLANIVKNAVVKYSNGRLIPEIQIIDQGLPNPPGASEEHLSKLSLERMQAFLGISKLTHPRESVEKLVAERIDDAARKE